MLTERDNIASGLATVLLWQGELTYSRILLLSWLGCHLATILFLWQIGSGYLWLDWLAMFLIVLVICRSKQRHIMQLSGMVFWYKRMDGHYICYQGEHYKLRNMPQRYYFLILFEITRGAAMQTGWSILLIAPDSLSTQQWRQLTTALAYQQCVKKGT